MTYSGGSHALGHGGRTTWDRGVFSGHALLALCDVGHSLGLYSLVCMFLRLGRGTSFDRTTLASNLLLFGSDVRDDA